MMKQSYSKVTLALLVLACLIVLVMIGATRPLTDVHWDAPIYMFHASRLNNTATIVHYAANAAEIARGIPNVKPFSGEYWIFSRSGHIALLGGVVTVFGATSASIQISTGLYILLMGLAVAISAFVATLILELFEVPFPRATVGNAAAFSAFLYTASDIFAYLAGNLVTEVPALLLLSISVWLLLKALQKRFLLLAVMSGTCGFLLYVVRMESIWNYMAFVLSLVPTLFWRARTRLWWPGIAAATASALALYVFYAWTFYPLANPGTFLEFAMSQKGFQHVDSPNAAALLVIAGGGLWIGFLLSLRAFSVSPVAQFSLCWTLLTVLPWIPGIILGLPVQTRMLCFVMLPLLLASTLGWAVQFDAWDKHRLGNAAFVLAALTLVLISNPLTYRLIQTLPVLWRIQYARPYLAAPERNTYPVIKLREVSQAIYASTVPTIVWWDPAQIREEDLWVVQYFAPRDARNVDATKWQNQSARNACDDNMPLPIIGLVLFCAHRDDDAIRQAKAGDVRILSLHARLSRDGPTDLHLEEINFNQPSSPKHISLKKDSHAPR